MTIYINYKFADFIESDVGSKYKNIYSLIQEEKTNILMNIAEKNIRKAYVNRMKFATGYSINDINVIEDIFKHSENSIEKGLQQQIDAASKNLILLNKDLGDSGITLRQIVNTKDAKEREVIIDQLYANNKLYIINLVQDAQSLLEYYMKVAAYQEEIVISLLNNEQNRIYKNSLKKYLHRKDGKYTNFNMLSKEAQQALKYLKDITYLNNILKQIVSKGQNITKHDLSRALSGFDNFFGAVSGSVKEIADAYGLNLVIGEANNFIVRGTGQLTQSAYASSGTMKNMIQKTVKIDKSMDLNEMLGKQIKADSIGAGKISINGKTISCIIELSSKAYSLKEEATCLGNVAIESALTINRTIKTAKRYYH